MPTSRGDTRARTIARLNDRCRLGLDPTARTVMTRRCLATFADGSIEDGLLAQMRILAAVRALRFADDDPAPRDHGDVAFEGIRIYFTIDAYDLSLTNGSEDPANPAVTIRVMTIMLREDL